MRALQIIENKRDGKEISAEEIIFMVESYSRGEIPDYQMAAFLMAAFINGLGEKELFVYTKALIDSGKRIDWEKEPGLIVDKHSSGGVGDKTTLVVAPLVASAGLLMPKMSGRGLGHTGGTLDKLESIPGFKTNLSLPSLREQIEKVGVAIVSQSEELTPADGKIYALRDVTATVDSIPLIAASIMSKKVAGGAFHLVLDVKAGEGAFMKSVDAARGLGSIMVRLGKEMGVRTSAVISDMNQPLGRQVGNSLEVREAIQVLQGEGPSDVKELALTLGSRLLLSTGKENSLEKAWNYLEEQLNSGRAYRKFEEMVSAQGGSLSSFHQSGPLDACFQGALKTSRGGYLSSMDALKIGKASALLGAGRFRKEEDLDHEAGLVLHYKVGEKVEPGAPLVSLYSRKKGANIQEAKRLIEGACEISSTRIIPPPLLHPPLE